MDIRFCDRCQESIPDGDFDAGRAVTIRGRALHVACALQRAQSAAGPRSWLTFLLALGAAGAAAFLWVREGGRGRAEDVSPAVARRIDEARDAAFGEARQRAEAAATAAEGADAQLARELTALKDELRLAREGFAERLERAEKSGAEALVPFGERLARLEQEVGDIGAWMKDVVRRAEERAAVPTPAPPSPPVAPPDRGVSPAEPPRETPATPPGPAPGTPDPDRAAEVDRWIERLKDPNEGIAFSATIELGRLKDLRAVPPLIDVLRGHRDFYARLGAATALGELRAVDAVPALTEGLLDKDDLVRTAADEALQAIAEPVLSAEDRKDLKFQANMGVPDRRRVVKAWERWWKANEAALRTARAQPAQ